ncbi:unnamed protein product [Symbiodinium sp. CCMP2592]|nr:unnamed protein product [Symbiodinium sp. CCMP2592]
MLKSRPQSDEHEWSGSWEWTWGDWAEQAWRADPWSVFLDSERPGWRNRRYANWTDASDTSSQWSGESPDDDRVPLPRLLARRENSPPPDVLLLPAIIRKTYSEPFGSIREQHRARDNHMALRNSEVILIVSVSGKSGIDGDIQVRVSERPVTNAGEEREFLKLHNSFPPEFKMRERAGKILNHLTVADVATDGGVELIKREMEKSPIIRLLEHKEVDRKRQKFMKLSRYPKESLESFINRASIYRHENDQCQNYKVGTKFYLGHLLDAAKLSRKDEALIKTASQGLHDEGRVVNAMLDLAEQLEGLHGYPIGKGEPDMPDEDKYLFQRRGAEGEAPARRDERSGRFQPGAKVAKGSRRHRMRSKWKQVFHTIMEDMDSSDDHGSEPAVEDEEPEEIEAVTGEDESTSGETDATADIPAEVFAQEYKAKKKVNEIKQMRQYYRKDPEKTKAWIKEQQKRAARMLEPPRVHVTSVTPGPATNEPEQWDMLESLAAYIKEEPLVVSGVRESGSVHGCLVTIDHTPLDHEIFCSMRELHSSLILDLGCMKSVAGTKWVNQHIQRLRGLGRWMKAMKEKESFRFGDGHELCSEYAFVFEATILGVRVILKLSVVPGECPPLLSKQACSQMGMIIDTEFHTVSSRNLKVQKYGLSQTFGGHYALPIAEFTEGMKPIHAPDIPEHLEAIPVYVAHHEVQVTEDSLGAPLRSWTRHDKAMCTTVGPGAKGPPRHAVCRRVVYDAYTGDKLIEESVGRSLSTNSMNAEPPTVASADLNGTPSEAGGRGLPGLSAASDWSRVDVPSDGPERHLRNSLEVGNQPGQIQRRGEDGRDQGLGQESERYHLPEISEGTTHPESELNGTTHAEPTDDLYYHGALEAGDLVLEDLPPRPKARSSSTTTVTTKAKGQTQRVTALTDLQADFPTLPNRYSDDLVINVALSLTCQLLTFKWKQLVWMLRIRWDVEMEMGDRSRIPGG